MPTTHCIVGDHQIRPDAFDACHWLHWIRRLPTYTTAMLNENPCHVEQSVALL